MVDDTEKTPTPIVRDGSTGDDAEFNYFALSAADRLKTVKEKIEEREKVYLELEMAKLSLTDNPEPGEHKTPVERPDGTTIPCQCGACELKRVTQMLRSNRFAINQLRALYARLQ